MKINIPFFQRLTQSTQQRKAESPPQKPVDVPPSSSKYLSSRGVGTFFNFLKKSDNSAGNERHLDTKATGYLRNKQLPVLPELVPNHSAQVPLNSSAIERGLDTRATAGRDKSLPPLPVPLDARDGSPEGPPGEVIGLTRVDQDAIGSEEAETLDDGPYVPIVPTRYAGYGTLNPAAVGRTDYARQTAEKLIAGGELDTSQIGDMIANASANPSWSGHYRQHVVRTLQCLQRDPELVALIDSICKENPPTGAAAEAVRAALLIPDDAPVTNADARKAVVMALLGDLRQIRTNDCFAIAPAICLHADSPVVVVRHMKEMLEKNYLSFEYKGVTSQAPFNRQFNRARTQVPLKVKANGTCYGTLHEKKEKKEYELYRTPGMYAALMVMGVPKDEMQDQIRDALRRLAPAGNQEVFNVTSEKLIKQIIDNKPGVGDRDKLVSSALRAFCAQETPALVDAWKNTIAAKGAVEANDTTGNTTISNMLFGKPVPGKNLPSLRDASWICRRKLGSEERFKDAPLFQIDTYLMAAMQDVMTRFCWLYDPDLEREVSSEGVASRGGWILHDRTADDPALWQRIDNAKAYQDAIARMVDVACNEVRTTVGNCSRDGFTADAQLNHEALRMLAEEMKKHVRADEFIERAKYFSANGGEPPTGEANSSLWRRAVGGSTTTILKYLGSKATHTEPVSVPGRNSPDKDADLDATGVVTFLCKGLSKMSTQLRAKRNESHADFRIPIRYPGHGFTMLPKEMEDVWLRGATPEEWIREALVEPMETYFDQMRDDPPLHVLMERLSHRAGVSKDEVNKIFAVIADRSPRPRNLQPSYTVRHVYEALKQHWAQNPNGHKKLETAEHLLKALIPPPAPKRVADTNYAWSNGDAEYLGVVHNPFKGRVEVYTLDESGGNATRAGKEWRTGIWTMYEPLPTR